MKNKRLLYIAKGNQEISIYEKEIAKVGAYSLGRVKKVTTLDLTPDELRFQRLSPEERQELGRRKLREHLAKRRY